VPLSCPGAPRAPALTLAFAFALTLAVLLGAVATAARAEMGPCVPDRFDGLVCGSGTGAARVVAGSVSPDKRFAFAWRDPEGEIESEPSDDLELLLVRLKDGAVLATRTTEYWATGEMHANRRYEDIVWSPDSRLAVRAFQTRYASAAFEFFALRDGKVQAIDLKKSVEPALRARLSAGERTDHHWSFAVDREGLTVSKTGQVHLKVTMWVPKDEPLFEFDVILQVMRSAKGLVADLVSVRRLKGPE
jgi:hypothetical protein